MDSGFEYDGPVNWLNRPKAAIVNSRQSKFPVGDDEWVISTCRAVDYLKDHKYIFLTSLGMNTWELPLTRAARLNLPIIIVASAPRNARHEFRENIVRRFQLDADRTGLLFLQETAGKGRKGWWPLRDLAIFDLADLVLPVSIRPEGSLGALIALNRPKIDSRFVISYQKVKRLRPRYDHKLINPDINLDEFLIHFTRSSDTAWPDETDYEFYQAIINSQGEYCHSARASLVHILRKGIIYGSSKNIREGFKVVGFSAVNGETISQLFRYRPRLVNPNFEPYGIALPKALARQMGLQPVMYGPPDKYQNLEIKDRPFFQSEGRRGGIWRHEQEWRYIGDYRLNYPNVRQTTIIIPDMEDMDSIREYTSSEIIPLFKD